MAGGFCLEQGFANYGAYATREQQVGIFLQKRAGAPNLLPVSATWLSHTAGARLLSFYTFPVGKNTPSRGPEPGPTLGPLYKQKTPRGISRGVLYIYQLTTFHHARYSQNLPAFWYHSQNLLVTKYHPYNPLEKTLYKTHVTSHPIRYTRT